MSRACPKYRALMAYQAGLLSHEGDRRVRAHLSRCETCRSALASMDVFEESAEWVRETSPPPIAWEPMEASLQEIAKLESRRVRKAPPRGLVGAVVLAAAAALVLWVQAPTDETAEVAERPEPVPSSVTAPSPLTAQVTTAAGCPTTAADETCLSVGADLHQGDTLRLAAAGETHIRLRAGTGLIIDRQAEVEFSELNEASIQVALRQGRVSSEVASLDETQAYEIQASGWTIRVRGTRFSVGLQGDEVSVQVDEGEVEILHAEGEPRRLPAPGRWSSSNAPQEESETTPLALPRGLDAGSLDWPILRLPDNDQVSTWEIDGTRLTAAGEIAMRVPAGELTILAFGPNGETQDLVVEVGEGGHLLESRVFTPAATSPRPPTMGVLAPGAISAVVQRGLPGLRQCYQRTLRNRPDQEGRFMMRVSLSATGEVRGIRVRGGGSNLPESLRSCITSRVQGWSFPTPEGGPVTFQVPLNFRTAGR